MRLILTGEAAKEILRPYHDTLMDNISLSFKDMLRVKDNDAENGLFSPLKQRTMGSYINDRIRVRMIQSFENDPNIFIQNSHVFGLLFDRKLFLRFNKMDHQNRVSLSNTNALQSYYNQSEGVFGMSEDVTLAWAGYVPDKSWSIIKDQVIVCSIGSTKWFYSLNGISVMEQTIETPSNEQINRLKLKNPDKQVGITKTGTDN